VIKSVTDLNQVSVEELLPVLDGLLLGLDRFLHVPLQLVEAGLDLRDQVRLEILKLVHQRFFLKLAPNWLK